MKLKVSYGYTFNKGNYESERIDVGVEIDVNSQQSSNGELPKIIKVFHNKLKSLVHDLGVKL